MREGGLVQPEADRVLTSSRRKWSVMAAGGAIFVAYGVASILRGTSVVIGWITVVLFGAGVILSVAQLIVPSRLVISDSVIHVHQLGRHWSRDLVRCGRFEVWRNPVARQQLVVFDHPDDQAQRLAGISRRLAGHSSALPDTYGKTATELARILNEARGNAHSAQNDNVPQR